MSGRGALVCEDGFTLNFGEGNGRVLLVDEAQCVQSAGQSVTLRGTGTLECVNGARLIIENGSSLTCGTKVTDVITLRVSTGASIRVGQDLGVTGTGARSYLSFAGSSGTLDCSRVGSIVISDKGMLECNALHGTARRGRMDTIDVSMGGTFYVGKGGTCTFAENIGGLPGITWNMLGGSLGGTGLIVLHDTVLSGKIQNTIFAETNVSSKVLVSRLLQTATGLTMNTIFYDAAGQRKLYTKNDVLVSLDVGTNEDVITSESSDGTVYGYDAVTGETFLYTATGVRL